MQISTFSDYCLRILIYLATCEGQRASSREIADRYAISGHHVAKASKWLVREGYVIGVRGRGGGLTLSRAPELIVIGDVLRKNEEDAGLVECMRADGGSCVISGACGLTGILEEAKEAFFRTLDLYTLADAVSHRHVLARMLMTHDKGISGTA